MNSIVFYILFFFVSFTSFGQSRLELREKAKKERTYNFFKIDSTKRYYIVEATVCKDSVVLVIDKKSQQLKDKKIKELGIYNFKTYQFFDTTYPSGYWCHEVDHKEIWCETDNKGLHFTDGMGNEYYDDEDSGRN